MWHKYKMKHLLLEELNLGDWDPPGKDEDPYWERGVDDPDWQYISHGWRRKDNKKDATKEQVKELHRLKNEKDKIDAEESKKKQEKQRIEDEKRKAEEAKRAEEERIAAEKAAEEAEKERVENLSPEERKKEEATAHREENRGKKPRRYRQVQGKVDYQEEEMSAGYLGKDSKFFGDDNRGDFTSDPAFQNQIYSYGGEAARLGGNVTNLIFNGIYNFNAIEWIGQGATDGGDGTDMIARVSKSVMISEEDEGSPGEEVLLGGERSDVEIGMGSGKRIMIGSTQDREIYPGVTATVFRQNRNLSTVTLAAMVEEGIIFESFEKAVASLPDLQQQIDQLPERATEAINSISSQQEEQQFVQTWGLSPQEISLGNDEWENLVSNWCEFQNRDSEAPIRIADPQYFGPGGTGTACSKKLLQTCWDRRGAGDTEGDLYWCRIDAQGGKLAGNLVRSSAAEVDKAIMITDRSEKALKDTKFMWADTRIQDSKQYSLTYHLLLSEATKDQPFEEKTIPTISEVLPESQPLDDRGLRDGWRRWGWEWDEGWKWENALKVEITQWMQMMIVNTRAR